MKAKGLGYEWRNVPIQIVGSIGEGGKYQDFFVAGIEGVLDLIPDQGK